MASLRPYKFVVTAIVQEVDDNDQVVGEPVAEPVTLYGLRSLERYAAEFERTLAAATTEQAER